MIPLCYIRTSWLSSNAINLMHLCEEQRRLLGEPVGPFEVPLRPSEAKLAEHDLLRRGPRLEGGRDGGNLKK